MDEKLMTLPVIALRGLTVLPEMIQHFDISRDKSISAVEHAMVGEQKVFLVTQRQIEEEDPDASGLFQIGTIARIKQLVKIPAAWSGSWWRAWKGQSLSICSRMIRIWRPRWQKRL